IKGRVTHMKLAILSSCAVVALLTSVLPAQRGANPPADDPIRTVVGRLDLEKYKATIKGLTQFGDRRQGTDRNKAAVDWIEAQLKSYGCSNTERITYDYQPAPARGNTGARGAQPAAAGRGQNAPAANQVQNQTAEGGGRRRGIRVRVGVNEDP